MKNIKEIPANHIAFAQASATDTPLWFGGVTFNMQNNEKEIWKDVVGYEGIYMVSNLFNIKSIRNNKYRAKVEKILKFHFNGHYYGVKLYRDGKSKYHKIHKIYADAFLPNPENKPFVNHINGIKTDNRIENLEWVTASENQKHSYRIGLSKPSFLRRKPISMFDSNMNYVCDFDSTYHAYRFLNPNAINGSVIIRAIKGNGKLRGYYFKYKN